MKSKMFLLFKRHLLLLLAVYLPKEHKGAIYLLPTVGIKRVPSPKAVLWGIYIFFLWFELSMSFIKNKEDEND